MYKIQFPINPTITVPNKCCCCGRNKTDTIHTLNIAHTTGTKRNRQFYGVSVVGFSICNECKKWSNCRDFELKIYVLSIGFTGIIMFPLFYVSLAFPDTIMQRIIAFLIVAIVFGVLILLITALHKIITKLINKGKPNEQCKVHFIVCPHRDASGFTLGFENTAYAQELLKLNKNLRVVK